MGGPAGRSWSRGWLVVLALGSRSSTPAGSSTSAATSARPTRPPGCSRTALIPPATGGYLYSLLLAPVARARRAEPALGRTARDRAQRRAARGTLALLLRLRAREGGRRPPLRLPRVARVGRGAGGRRSRTSCSPTTVASSPSSFRPISASRPRRRSRRWSRCSSRRSSPSGRSHRDDLDGLTAGLAAGLAIAIEAGNAAFLPAPVLALVVARRPRALLGFGLGLVPGAHLPRDLEAPGQRRDRRQLARRRLLVAPLPAEPRRLPRVHVEPPDHRVGGGRGRRRARRGGRSRPPCWSGAGSPRSSSSRAAPAPTSTAGRSSVRSPRPIRRPSCSSRRYRSSCRSSAAGSHGTGRCRTWPQSERSRAPRPRALRLPCGGAARADPRLQPSGGASAAMREGPRRPRAGRNVRSLRDRQGPLGGARLGAAGRGRGTCRLRRRSARTPTSRAATQEALRSATLARSRETRVPRYVDARRQRPLGLPGGRRLGHPSARRGLRSR